MKSPSPHTRRIIFESVHTPISVHNYENDPNVYFLNKRDTNVHVATLSFENNNNDAYPVALRALLAICINQLQQNTTNLFAAEVVPLLHKATALLDKGEEP